MKNSNVSASAFPEGVYSPAREAENDLLERKDPSMCAHREKKHLSHHKITPIGTHTENNNTQKGKKNTPASLTGKENNTRKEGEKAQTGCFFTAYTDGSSDNKHPLRPSGAAYLILDKEGNCIHKASKGFAGKTNNFCEMMAIISAVNWVPRGASIVVYSDSQYAIKVFTREWHPKKNLDLVEMFDRVRWGKRVSLRWVKGHNGNTWNEECDRMANAEFLKTKTILECVF